jgi:hypothetical protein
MRRFMRLCSRAPLALFVLFASTGARSQEPATPPPPETATAPAANTRAKPGATKYPHANDFLIRGTVFNDKALSFPNLELSIRRVGEKKFRWQGLTNSRGEFAMRVPKGAEYELVVRAKGFKYQVRTIDAKNGLSEENAIIRMELVAGDKK